MRTPIDHCDLLQVWEVYINIRAQHLQLKRFGMRSQFEFFVDAFAGGCVNDRKRTCCFFPIAYVQTFAGGIVTEVVHIVAKVDRSHEFKRRPVINVQFAFVTSNKELIRVGSKSDALRLGDSADGVNDPSSADVDDLFSIVPERGNKELSLGV